MAPLRNNLDNNSQDSEGISSTNEHSIPYNWLIDLILSFTSTRSGIISDSDVFDMGSAQAHIWRQSMGHTSNLRLRTEADFGPLFSVPKTFLTAIPDASPPAASFLPTQEFIQPLLLVGLARKMHERGGWNLNHVI